MRRRSPGRKPPAGGSLLVVGTGITGIGQTTLEAVEAIKQAQIVFYLVTEPITALWLQQLNARTVSLADLYGDDKPRHQTYREMVERIVSAVRDGLRVCTVFYGHPGVMSQPTHAAIRLLRREGYAARMLPGVSADGCLYADLGINPGDQGTQSFEATDFLMSRRRFDPTSVLILWQVGVLGAAGTQRGACRPERLQVLTDSLLRSYPANHRVVLYYAATFPADPPVIKRVALARLPQTKVWPLALLYVPALRGRPLRRRIVKWYGDD